VRSSDTFLTRLWSKTIFCDTGCWLFTGSHTDEGYGRIRLGNTIRFVHRAAYEFIVGEIPDGLVLDHLCRSRDCWNPDHLEPVTERVNILRGLGITALEARRDRCPAGHEYSTKLTKRGGRVCLKCRRKQSLASYYKKRSI
jgi:hypothetical protein